MKKEEKESRRETILKALTHAEFNAAIIESRLREGKLVDPERIERHAAMARDLGLLAGLRPLFRGKEGGEALIKLLGERFPVLEELHRFVTGGSGDYQGLIGRVACLSYRKTDPESETGHLSVRPKDIRSGHEIRG